MLAGFASLRGKTPCSPVSRQVICRRPRKPRGGVADADADADADGLAGAEAAGSVSSVSAVSSGA
ncbi:hypothetical protein, partial [Actinoplanes sp. NPDC049802]|uniref:hypothetical protein n=1 Tax=Actinoplanes sp. NPDC049802 TaxID=3154742 RepID=UPI0033F905A0